MTFRPCPPLGSILHGLVIPDKGRGDTEFLSMAAAFDALPAEKQAWLSGLEAEHSFEYGFKESLAQPGGRERLAQVCGWVDRVVGVLVDGVVWVDG